MEVWRVSRSGGDWRLFSGRVLVSKATFTAVGEEAEETSARKAAFFI